MSRWLNERGIVLEAAREVLRKGLVGGTAGNLSLRLTSEGGHSLLAITPHGRYYDQIVVEDIPVVDFEAETVEGELAPSVETMLHVGIMKARKDVCAVVHTHSVYACILAVAGLDIPPILDEQVVYVGDGVRLAEYGLPGSEQLVDNAVSALGKNNAVLLRNHGAVGVGRTMRDALTVCEIVEATAKVYYCALTLGKVSLLPEEALEVERAFFSMRQEKTSE